MRRALYFALIVLLPLTAFARQKYQKPGPVHLDHAGEKWAEKTLHKLSLEEKVGQLFVIWVPVEFLNVNDPQFLTLRDTIRKYHLGGLTMTVHAEGPFLYKNEPYEAADLLNRLQEASRVPLIVSADFERGVAMRLNGTTAFPHAMAFGATGKPEYAEDAGRITAQEARAIGVEWNFFPDADVNSNPANPIINIRSYGSDPGQVGDFVAAYIRGSQEYGMIATAKHFPGHGDTATDSHLGVAKVTGNMARLESVELPPFRKAIAAGVGSIMVAHLSVPALEPNPDRVATTSSAITTGMLKNQLGFKGLIVTDALNMGALTRLYEANIGREAVDAFKAGNDVLLIPPDLDACYRAMVEAVRSGEIAQSRLDESVLKILKAKASVGLNKARLVDISKISNEVGRPQNLMLAQKIADYSITLVRDNGKVLPLKKSGTTKPLLPYMQTEGVSNHLVVVVFTDDVRTPAGRTLARQIRFRVPDVNVMYVDAKIAAGMTTEVLNAIQRAQTVVAAVEAAPVPGKMTEGEEGTVSSSALPSASATLMRQILGRAAGRTVVVALGNPYLASDFTQVQNYMCAFSNEAISENSVARALFGEIAVHGHLPVNIPGIANLGAGIELPGKPVQGVAK